MGGAYRALLTEGDVFKGVNMGEVGPRWEPEFGVVPIGVVETEYGVLVGGVGVTVQQRGKWHGDLRLYWDRWE
jgi:hypothetical protein